MNRFKKELRKRGVMMENDYPYLPYGSLETVEVNSETCTVSCYYNVIGWEHTHYDRAMNESEVRA